MVKGHKVPVVREQRRVLGILSADRQAEDLVQITVIRIDPVDHDGVVAGVGTDQILEVRREIQSTGSRACGVIIVESRDRLDLLKIGSAVYFVIKIYIDYILELMDNVKEMAVLGELQVSGSRFEFGMKDRALFDVSVLSVEGIHIDVIHSEIRSQKEMIVSGHLHALYMGTEITLRNTAEPLQKELVTDIPDRSVFIDPEHCDLAVMITGNKEEFVLIVCREVRASHPVDRSEVDLFKISSLNDPVCFNSKIGDGIQILPVMRDRYI